MPSCEDWHLTGVVQAEALVKRLDRTPCPIEFGESLLEISAQFKADIVTVGQIPRQCYTGSSPLCAETDRMPLPLSPRKQTKSHQIEKLLPLAAETHVFVRDATSPARHYRILADEMDDMDSGPGKGLLFPAIADHRGFYGVSFFGASLSMNDDSRRTLGLLAYYTVARALRYDRAAPQLSSRQIETLQWAAAGKTDYEIAVILGLSEHTVDKYMRQSREALGAVNRTALIVQAMRLGLIA